MRFFFNFAKLVLVSNQSKLFLNYRHDFIEKWYFFNFFLTKKWLSVIKRLLVYTFAREDISLSNDKFKTNFRSLINCLISSQVGNFIWKKHLKQKNAKFFIFLRFFRFQSFIIWPHGLIGRTSVSPTVGVVPYFTQICFCTNTH